MQVRIPALGIRSSLERLGIGADGALSAPRDPAQAGWYADGPTPGDLGAAVIAGHVDSTSGHAVFWRLAQLHRSDRVEVTRSDGTTVRFAVQEVRRVRRDRFPTVEVYGPLPDRGLRLITCGGLYDHQRGRYRDNIVVFALAT